MPYRSTGLSSCLVLPDGVALSFIVLMRRVLRGLRGVSLSWALRLGLLALKTDGFLPSLEKFGLKKVLRGTMVLY